MYFEINEQQVHLNKTNVNLCIIFTCSMLRNRLLSQLRYCVKVNKISKKLCYINDV
jgi:hypothetical protein